MLLATRSLTRGERDTVKGQGKVLSKGGKNPRGEPGASVAVSKVSKRITVPGSTSVLGVRGWSRSRGDDNEGDAGCDRSWGGDEYAGASSDRARSPSLCDFSVVDGLSEGAFAAGGS